jgi:hypothetical protein
MSAAALLGVGPLAVNMPCECAACRAAPAARTEAQAFIMPSPFADGEVIASLVPERPDSFDVAMAKVEELREARRDSLARRDRAEWDCFFHFACENSLFKRQAE